MLNASLINTEITAGNVMDDAPVRFTKLKPSEIIKLATIKTLSKIIPQGDLEKYIYIIFNGPNSEALHISIKYYLLLKNGYDIDNLEVAFVGEGMDPEERFDPSHQIAYDFYRYQEMLSNNSALSIRNRTNRAKLQKTLKDEIDSSIKEYMVNYAKHLNEN